MLVGKSRLLHLIRPQALTPRILLLVLIPLAGAGLYRLVPGMDYERPSLWITLLLITTTFGNGFFEELLWRGVYLVLFPGDFWLGMLWPTFWFASGTTPPDRSPLVEKPGC